MKYRFLLAVIIFTSHTLFAQQKENDFVKLSVTGTLTDTNDVKDLIWKMNKQDNAAIFQKFASIFALESFNAKSPDIIRICADIKSSFIVSTDSGYTVKKDAAVIFIYRNMLIDSKVPNKPELRLDFTSMNSLVFAKDFTSNWTNYLLGSRHVIFVFVDAGAEFYKSADEKKENQLSNSHIKIDYKTSYFKQSFKDLTSLVGSVNGLGAEDRRLELNLTFFEIDPARIKEPCDIVVQNKTFAKDISFTVHERNFASFQVGLVNNSFTAKNFSITGGNLVVKPDSLQNKEWKSNLYALAEFHIPRDIDNFRPVWQVLFQPNPNKHARNFSNWLYDITLARIGVYGGLKISKDPLSNIYAGFNYAITKELYINFGWTWANETVPQVTSVGSITSIDDALKYAHRKYSPGQFSWGLSFSPSSVISMLGLKEKKSE